MSLKTAMAAVALALLLLLLATCVQAAGAYDVNGYECPSGTGKVVNLTTPNDLGDAANHASGTTCFLKPGIYTLTPGATFIEPTGPLCYIGDGGQCDHQGCWKCF